MKSKQKQKSILLLLIFLLFIINYSFLDSRLIEIFDETQTVVVQRVIDGDTIVAEGNSIRLLGINTPEKGELYYQEAKEFLEKLILNKSIKLKGEEKDRYNRTLSYIFLKNENINLKIVEEGFATPYFPQRENFYKEIFKKTWEECVDENKNMCEKSTNKCADCIELKNFDYKNEIVILYNECSYSCDLTSWQIKDEGRKKFIFPEFILSPVEDLKIIVGEGKDTKNKLYWEHKTYIWTKSGDTMFLRDEKERLILFKNY